MLKGVIESISILFSGKISLVLVLLFLYISFCIASHMRLQANQTEKEYGMVYFNCHSTYYLKYSILLIKIDITNYVLTLLNG